MAERKNIVKDKSFSFAVKIVNLCKLLELEREYILSKQLMRSGTAIGALIREAEQAESSRDFIHKMSIAQKEANESMYWLELLQATKLIGDEIFEDLKSKNIELIKLLTTIIKTKKKNINH